ncbi:MAG: 5' nucleotidase, NT5C type [Halohasta sp.]
MDLRLDSAREHTVLLDVDGTLCDNVPRLVEYINAECGTDLSRASITEWSFSIPGTDFEVGDLIKRALDDRPEWFLLGMEPIDGAAEAARWFADGGHTVEIATHRPPESHPLTAQWLDEHDIPYDSIIQDVPRNKGRLDGDLLVDDYHINVRNALAAGMEGGLFVQPYSDPSVCTEAVVAETWSSMLTEFGHEPEDSQRVGSTH